MKQEQRKSTKAAVVRLATKLNVSIEDLSTDSFIHINLYTPKGIRFKATECHTAATSFDRAFPGEPTTEYAGKMPDAWGCCMDDLEYGVEECTNPNCGVCERGHMNE